MINEPAVDVLIRKLGAEENAVMRFASWRPSAPARSSRRKETAAFTILRAGTRRS